MADALCIGELRKARRKAQALSLERLLQVETIELNALPELVGQCNFRIGSCVTSVAGPHGIAQLYENEGRSFGFGNQVLIPSHRELLRSKAMVVSIAETSGR